MARRRKTAQGLARRARIVLAAAEGLENQTIAEQVGAAANTLGKWRRRFAEHGVDGLHDEPRSGAPAGLGGGDGEADREMGLADPRRTCSGPVRAAASRRR